MKFNKIKSALVAMGVFSLAAAAQAQTNVVYVNGSTAARSFFYAACTNIGQVFDPTNSDGSTAIPRVIPSGTANNAQLVVFEGPIKGNTVDINCNWSGSEAGIASTAGQPLTQHLGPSANPYIASATYNLPNVPPVFLVQSSGWTTTNKLSVIRPSNTKVDLAMADNSQAVSRTPTSVATLNDYGTVGVVPFTFMKGYQNVKSSSWSNIVNVTLAQINQNINGPLVANFYTGNTNDTDQVIICGRNFGSGTRVNFLLNIQHGIKVGVDQWSVGCTYPTNDPTALGILTFGGNYGPGQGVQEVLNDGFDSGSGVQKNLNVDGSTNGYVMLGYMGLSDAANAFNNSGTGAGSGAATYLPFNGVYESDSAVINGNYTYWGQEHLLGSTAIDATGSQVATNLVAGIAANLLNSGAGTKTGAVGPTYTAQSNLLPTSLMRATRQGVDGGFPTQCLPGGF